MRLDLYHPPNPGRNLGDQLTITGLYGIRFGKGVIGMRCYTKDSTDQGFFEPPEYPASEASAEKGEKYLEILTDYLADFIEEFKKIGLLPQDYSKMA